MIALSSNEPTAREGAGLQGKPVHALSWAVFVSGTAAGPENGTWGWRDSKAGKARCCLACSQPRFGSSITYDSLHITRSDS